MIIYKDIKEMNNKYDYLIVGAGLFGSTFAYEMTKVGKKCLIIESKEHIAGNCYTENKDGINIHTYGPHIFHTNDKGIWEWVNQFAEFNNYRHCVRVSYDNNMYSFPINLMTLNQLWSVKTPEEAKAKLKSVSIPNDNIEHVSCKKFIYDDPLKTHAIIGTMFFRKAKYFIDGLNKNYQENIRTNNEFYVDDVLNQNINDGLKVKVFEVENYICWGTPDDYKTYNYWKEYFNKIK